MKKFKVTVTRTVDYEVEVDETLWSAETREKWQKTFWGLYPTSYESENPDEEAAAEFAVALAEQSVRLGCNKFIEGFGMCAQDKEYADAWNGMKLKRGEDTNLCTNGLYIREGDDYTESEIEEMED